MTTASDDIDGEINTLLKDIDEKEQILVIGYIRQNAFNAYNIFIPQYIINFCIVYLFAVFEKFDETKNWDKVNLDEKNSIIRYKTDNNDWNNIFGKATISMNTGIHQWIFKVFQVKSRPFLMIGIVSADIINNYDYEESKKYRYPGNFDTTSNNWFINEYFKGHGYHVGNGDFHEQYPLTYKNLYPMTQRGEFYKGSETMIKMIFDTNNRTLRYLMNNTEGSHKYAMENVKAQKYKMAVSSRHRVNVQLISYQRYHP